MSILDIALPPLSPETFFEVSADVFKASVLPSGRSRKRFSLPDTSLLLDQETFAVFYMSWDVSGISIDCQVQQPFSDCVYPKFDEGDGLELFIDTRDLKTVGVVHRFCHQFLFLPVEVQGVKAVEITQFRGDDLHPLADPSELVAKTVLEKKSYSFSIFLPKEVLHGYDPIGVPRLGFSYRLHRHKGEPQHFTLSTRACSIERNPALWASLQLKE
ncbi:MAG: hypothetical protein KGZ39_00560 [Simkania sp.]|nr:hypothetical protein [Simkania sp.]